MGPHKSPGRPQAVIPNARLASMVSRMAEKGLTQDAVAYVLGIGENTLKRRLGDAFKAGIPSADDQVKRSLFWMATEGKVPSAAIFWAKARLGWRESSRIEVSFAPIMERLMSGLLDLLHRVIPDACPACKTNLGLKPEIAKMLLLESQKLTGEAAAVGAAVSAQERDT